MAFSSSSSSLILSFINSWIEFVNSSNVFKKKLKFSKFYELYCQSDVGDIVLLVTIFKWCQRWLNNGDHFKMLATKKYVGDIPIGHQHLWFVTDMLYWRHQSQLGGKFNKDFSLSIKKSVIEYYFLLPDFKFRRQPRCWWHRGGPCCWRFKVGENFKMSLQWEFF